MAPGALARSPGFLVPYSTFSSGSEASSRAASMGFGAPSAIFLRTAQASKPNSAIRARNAFPSGVSKRLMWKHASQPHCLPPTGW